MEKNKRVTLKQIMGAVAMLMRFLDEYQTFDKHSADAIVEYEAKVALIAIPLNIKKYERANSYPLVDLLQRKGEQNVLTINPGTKVTERFLTVGSMHPVFRRGDHFFNGKNQILSDIHLPTRLDADAYVGGRFTHNLARHREMTLADNDQHNHWLSKPKRINGRRTSRSLCGHVVRPPNSWDRLHQERMYL